MNKILKWYLLGCMGFMQSLQGAARNPHPSEKSLICINGILYYEHEEDSPCLSGFTCAAIQKGKHIFFQRKAEKILGGEVKSWDWKKRGLVVLTYPANISREELLKEAKCFDDEWGYSRTSQKFDIIIFREEDLDKREAVVALSRREILGLR